MKIEVWFTVIVRRIAKLHKEMCKQFWLSIEFFLHIPYIYPHKKTMDSSTITVLNIFKKSQPWKSDSYDRVVVVCTLLIALFCNPVILQTSRVLQFREEKKGLYAVYIHIKKYIKFLTLKSPRSCVCQCLDYFNRL